jgi:hypothetical protein
MIIGESIGVPPHLQKMIIAAVDFKEEALLSQMTI